MELPGGYLNTSSECTKEGRRHSVGPHALLVEHIEEMKVHAELRHFILQAKAKLLGLDEDPQERHLAIVAAHELLVKTRQDLRGDGVGVDVRCFFGQVLLQAPFRDELDDVLAVLRVLSQPSLECLRRDITFRSQKLLEHGLERLIGGHCHLSLFRFSRSREFSRTKPYPPGRSCRAASQSSRRPADRSRS